MIENNKYLIWRSKFFATYLFDSETEKEVKELKTKFFDFGSSDFDVYGKEKR
jgi:hypothetical protein